MNLRTGVILSAVLTVMGALSIYQPGSYAWIGDQTGYAPVQPLEFSHKLHAKDYSIPCEYCHFAARRGPVAGIPPSSVCMNCHAQVGRDRPEVKKLLQAVEKKQPIAWVRVHDLPDFVRFDHSAHLSKGITCQQCHGPVQDMARVEQTRHLSMGWCVTCHRQSTRRPPPGAKDIQASAECSTCHY